MRRLQSLAATVAFSTSLWTSATAGIAIVDEYDLPSYAAPIGKICAQPLCDFSGERDYLGQLYNVTASALDQPFGSGSSLVFVANPTRAEQAHEIVVNSSQLQARVADTLATAENSEMAFMQAIAPHLGSDRRAIVNAAFGAFFQKDWEWERIPAFLNTFFDDLTPEQIAVGAHYYRGLLLQRLIDVQNFVRNNDITPTYDREYISAVCNPFRESWQSFIELVDRLGRNPAALQAIAKESFPFRTVFSAEQVEVMLRLCENSVEDKDQRCFEEPVKKQTALYSTVYSTEQIEFNGAFCGRVVGGVYQICTETDKFFAPSDIKLRHTIDLYKFMLEGLVYNFVRSDIDYLLSPKTFYEAQWLTSVDYLRMLSRSALKRGFRSYSWWNAWRLKVFVSLLDTDFNHRLFAKHMLAEFPTLSDEHGEVLPQLLRMTWRSLTPLQLADGVAQSILHIKSKITAAELYASSLGQSPSAKWLEEACGPIMLATINLDLLQNQMDSSKLKQMDHAGVLSIWRAANIRGESLYGNQVKKFFEDFGCYNFAKLNAEKIYQELNAEMAPKSSFWRSLWAYVALRLVV